MSGWLTVRSVKELLVSRSAEWHGQVPDDLSVFGPVYERRRPAGRHPSVTIFRGRSRALPHDLAIKVFHEASGGTKAAEWVSREAAVLDRLTAARDSHAALAPAHYFSSIEHGLICTQWLRGINLRSVLRAGGAVPGLRERTLKRAGRWLRAYHDAMGRSTGAVNLSERMETLKALLNCSGRAFRRCDRHLRVLTDYAGSHNTVRVDISVSHGDFGPSNLMFVDMSLSTAGFDFSLPGQAPVTDDIATFLANRFVERLTMGARWEAVPEYRAFMLGYCDNRRMPNGQLLSWQMLHCALVGLVQYESELAKGDLTRQAATWRRGEIVRLKRVADIVADSLR